MPEYLAPGVYVEEIDLGGRPIEGVGTSTAGLLGPTERGPTNPQLVTSFTQFTQIYGGSVANSYMASAVDGFFRNGGQRCFIGRVVSLDSSAKASNITLPSLAQNDWIWIQGNTGQEEAQADLVRIVSLLGTTVNITSTRFGHVLGRTVRRATFAAVGALGAVAAAGSNSINLDATAAGQLSQGDWILIQGDIAGQDESARINGPVPIVGGVVALTSNLVFSHASGRRIQEAGFASVGTLSAPVGATGTSITLTTTSVIQVDAIGKGGWGNRIYVKVENGSLFDATSRPDSFKLTFYYWRTLPPTVDVGTVIDPLDSDNRNEPRRRDPDVLEVYDNLSSSPNSSDYFMRRINGISRLVQVKQLAEARPIVMGIASPPVAGVPGDALNLPLSGGSDGPTSGIALADYQGATTIGARTGLAAFEEVDEIAIAGIPDEHSITGLTGELIDHCERLKDRFAVTAVVENMSAINPLRPVKDTKYAAVYYPWIKIIDPVSGATTKIPPTGHVMGIYARSDVERGVHKAPANEVVRGAVDLEFNIAKGEQDILNPRGVNVIRSFIGRGIRVWGARTMSSDSSWKYVNVRRLFIFLEESIDEATQYAVFEPNNTPLWEGLRGSVTAFLTTQWRNGALQGTTAEQAFFVKVGLGETMTQDDIDNGRVIMLIGVAPVKPAEFVIFRIAQMPRGSEVTE